MSEMKECLSAIIRNILMKNSPQGFILLLSISMTIAVSLNSQSCAEEGLVYPDSARISFDWSTYYDTVTVSIINGSSTTLTDLFISDFTDSSTIIISCLIDGVYVDSIEMDSEFGSVYPDMYTTRWIIESFSDSLILKYFCPSYDEFQVCFSAGNPFPVFGIMPEIGAPREVTWMEDIH